MLKTIIREFERGGGRPSETSDESDSGDSLVETRSRDVPDEENSPRLRAIMHVPAMMSPTPSRAVDRGRSDSVASISSVGGAGVAADAACRLADQKSTSSKDRL